jgi:hypothetical protein
MGNLPAEILSPRAARDRAVCSRGEIGATRAYTHAIRGTLFDERYSTGAGWIVQPPTYELPRLFGSTIILMT